MKVFKCILKIVTALAALLGLIYVMATYGDRIVAWCRKHVIAPLGARNVVVEDASDVPAEEAPVEEVPAEDAPADEASAAIVVEESDFEG